MSVARAALHCCREPRNPAATMHVLMGARCMYMCAVATARPAVVVLGAVPLSIRIGAGVENEAALLSECRSKLRAEFAVDIVPSPLHPVDGKTVPFASASTAATVVLALYHCGKSTGQAWFPFAPRNTTGSCGPQRRGYWEQHHDIVDVQMRHLGHRGTAPRGVVNLTCGVWSSSQLESLREFAGQGSESVRAHQQGGASSDADAAGGIWTVPAALGEALSAVTSATCAEIEWWVARTKSVLSLETLQASQPVLVLPDGTVHAYSDTGSCWWRSSAPAVAPWPRMT